MAVWQLVKFTNNKDAAGDWQERQGSRTQHVPGQLGSFTARFEFHPRQQTHEERTSANGCRQVAAHSDYALTESVVMKRGLCQCLSKAKHCYCLLIKRDRPSHTHLGERLTHYFLLRRQAPTVADQRRNVASR